MAVNLERVSIPARPATRELWGHRLGLPIITVLGFVIASTTWTSGAPLYVAAFGLVVAALGAWLQLLVELAPRGQLVIQADNSVRIRARTLLSQDVVLPASEVASITYREPTINTPRDEHTATILGRGGYVRIELNTPRTLKGARWTNLIWYLRAESDYTFIPPPLPHRPVRVLHFSASPLDAASLVRRLGQ